MTDFVHTVMLKQTPWSSYTPLRLLKNVNIWAAVMGGRATLTIHRHTGSNEAAAGAAARPPRQGCTFSALTELNRRPSN